MGWTEDVAGMGEEEYIWIIRGTGRRKEILGRPRHVGE
jgi:hypothetical protein